MPADTCTRSDLIKEYDRLQAVHGGEGLRSILWGGCQKEPDVCFVFMNPTGRNVAASPGWEGIRAPWLGTKPVWEIFYRLGYLTDELYDRIRAMKPGQWTETFADELYSHLAEQKIYITNLGKCTLPDARHLPDSVYRDYLSLFWEELRLTKPKKIIAFGNQVSSLLLGRNISVSQCRKQQFSLAAISLAGTPLWAVYYPVGNGRFNLPKAMEDLEFILGK